MISIYSKNNTDFEHNGDAVLIPTSCKLSATINGAWQLTLEHPYDPEERYKYIIEGATIVADIRFIRELSTVRQKFRIYNYVKGLHSVTAIAFPIAMESTYDAPIDNLVISGKTGAQAMAQLQTKTNKYTLSSDITRTGSTSFSNTNINSAIASGDEGCFIDVWGGDILYDNLTFAVKNRLGDNVAASHPVIYGRNLTDIEYKKDDSGLTTRIYPISQDGIRLNGTGYVDSSRISDYPVPHSKFMTAPYSLIDTNAGSSTSTATKTQQAVSAVSTSASTTSQSVYATLKGNGYQPEYIKTIRNAIVEAVQTMALASVVSTSYYNLMANTIKSAMDWMGSLSQPKWGWMGSDQTGWKYGDASSYAKNMYVKIGKTWSYFGNDGNWQEPKDDSDEWDWHDAKGGTGKKYGNFTKYYAHNEYVYITVSGTIKEYWFNEQGWFEEDESGDSDYYWHGSGTGADPYWFGASSTDYLKSCWRFIDGTYYFFDSYGYVATQKDNYQWDWNENGDSSRAWFGNAVNSEYGSDGACLKSQWQKINGTWYYFDSNGLVVDEAVSQTQTVAAFTSGMASVKTTVDSWASQLYTLLYSLMTAYANKQFASGVDLPTITITVKMADLKKTTEYADYAHLEEIKLGDSVKCIDAVHDITTENRIIGITYDILRDYNEIIVIGSASATVAQMVGNAGGEAAAQGFDTTAIENQLTALRNGKQDKLTAGDNITIVNNVISSTAGSGKATIYSGSSVPSDSLGVNNDLYLRTDAVAQELVGEVTEVDGGMVSYTKTKISNNVYNFNQVIKGNSRWDHVTYQLNNLIEGDSYRVIFTHQFTNATFYNNYTNQIYVTTTSGTDGSVTLETDNSEHEYTFEFTAGSNNTLTFSYPKLVDGRTTNSDISNLTFINLSGIKEIYGKINGHWEKYNGNGGGGTTYSDFVGATSEANGTHGLVPAPLIADRNKYLKGDGTWAEVQGASAVSELTDVSLNNLSNNQILKYNSTTQKWENASGGGGGGSEVEPNPSGTPTDTLETIGIDGTIYDIAGGGSSGGSAYTETVLWENSSGLSFKPNDSKTISLADDVTNYDALSFAFGGSTTANTKATFIISTSDLINYSNEGVLGICTRGSINYNPVTYYIDNTHLMFGGWTNSETCYAYKVTGIKYGGGGGSLKLEWNNKETVATSLTTSFISYTPPKVGYLFVEGYGATADASVVININGAPMDLVVFCRYDSWTTNAFLVNGNEQIQIKRGSASLGDVIVYFVPISGGGSEVEANPTDPATDTINTIKIDGTIYNVPSGGGSDLPLTVENGKLCIIYET